MMSNRGMDKVPPQTRPLFYAEWLGTKIHTLYRGPIVTPKSPPGTKSTWIQTGYGKGDLVLEGRDQDHSREKREDMVVLA